MSASSGAASLLKRQLKDIQASKDLQGVSCGLVNDNNLFEWEVMVMINDDCKYYGGTPSASSASKLPLSNHATSSQEATSEPQ